MRLVHVSTHYYPLVGGMERVVQGLAEAQVKLGHEVIYRFYVIKIRGVTLDIAPPGGEKSGQVYYKSKTILSS